MPPGEISWFHSIAARWRRTSARRERNLSRNLAQLTEHGVRIRGREIVIDRKELLEAFARPQRFIDDPAS